MGADVNHRTLMVGALQLRKNWGSHIDASHSRQPLVKGERLVRHEVNAVMLINRILTISGHTKLAQPLLQQDSADIGTH